MGIRVDWSGLPQEIMESISKWLTIYADYLRFRCVCRSWNSSVPKTPLHLPTQLPWLMLSHDSFVDLSTNKFHRLNLPPPSRLSRICGSSHGWLIIVKQTSEISLLNPITRATFSLPSFQTLDANLFYYKPNGFYHIDHIKVVLSSSPSLSDDDFVAFAVLNRNDFVFCKKGYDSWVHLNHVSENNRRWIDAIYNNGSFYVLNRDGIIAVCDVEDPGVSFVEVQDHAPVAFICFNDTCHIVFAGEDVLFFHRSFIEEPQGEYVVRFWIFKMNWNAQHKWEVIQTLGDQHSVFIGKNSSLYFSAVDIVGCRPNCIYFTDDLVGKHEFGVYSVSDKSVDRLPCDPYISNMDYGYPIWLTPSPT